MTIMLAPNLDGMGDQDHFDYIGVLNDEAENFESEKQRMSKAAHEFYADWCAENLDRLREKSEQYAKDQEMLKLAEMPIREILINHKEWLKGLDKNQINDHSYMLTKMHAYATSKLQELGQCIVTLVDASGKIIADQECNFTLNKAGCWESETPCVFEIPTDANPKALYVTFGNGRRFTIANDISQNVHDQKLSMEQITLGHEVKP